MKGSEVTSLSDRDHKVPQLIQQTVNMSVAEIGKTLGLKEHVVRRCIERLRDFQAIHPYVPINTAALGFSEYQIILD